MQLAARCSSQPAVFRSILFSLLALHVINAIWFQIGYMGGSPFTPELNQLSSQSISLSEVFT
jgi:hypothetical protein